MAYTLTIVPTMKLYNNKFHDPTGGGAGILLKGGSNLIHDNEFYNMPTNAATSD